MSDFEKQLNKAVKATKLTADEKRELKARVVSYMEYHPRRETVAEQKAQQYLESQPYTVLNFNNLFIRGVVGAFAVFMVVFVPSLAERAVPGDVLYPIKVRVNEEIRSSLTFSAADKVAWETERLERRIAEVRLLAEEGKLTAEVEAAAAEAVKAHAEAAQDGINKLRDTDAEEAVLAEVAFESALEVQTAVLDADTEESEDEGGTDVIALASVVREAQETVEASKGDTKPSAEKIAARLEQQTTRAYELFTSLEDKVTPEERAEIERRLQDIERAIAFHTGEQPAEVEVADEVAEEVTEESVEDQEPVEEVTEDIAVASMEAADESVETTEEVAEEPVIEEVTEESVEDQEPVEAEEVTPAVVVDSSEVLLEVLADIQKLISFMTGLDVRTSVEIEELVPVVLTPEEREVELETKAAHATNVVADSYRVIEAGGLSEGEVEKIKGTLAEIESVIAQLSPDTAEGAESPAELSLEERESLFATIADYVVDIEAVIAPFVSQLPAEDESEEVVEEEGEVIEETGTTTEEVVEPQIDEEAEVDTETSEEAPDEAVEEQV